MVRFYENPTKHSGVIKEIFKERDVFPLPSFFFLLSFFFYCFPSLEDTHTIKKCYFIKTVIHKYDYIQRLETEPGKICQAFSTSHWEGTLRTP